MSILLTVVSFLAAHAQGVVQLDMDVTNLEKVTNVWPFGDGQFINDSVAVVNFGNAFIASFNIHSGEIIDSLKIDQLVKPVQDYVNSLYLGRNGTVSQPNSTINSSSCQTNSYIFRRLHKARNSESIYCIAGSSVEVVYVPGKAYATAMYVIEMDKNLNVCGITGLPDEFNLIHGGSLGGGLISRDSIVTLSAKSKIKDKNQPRFDLHIKKNNVYKMSGKFSSLVGSPFQLSRGNTYYRPVWDGKAYLLTNGKDLHRVSSSGKTLEVVELELEADESLARMTSAGGGKFIGLIVRRLDAKENLSYRLVQFEGLYKNVKTLGKYTYPKFFVNSLFNIDDTVGVYLFDFDSKIPLLHIFTASNIKPFSL